MPPWLAGEETRLDIDPRWEPDIVASMTDLGDIGPFDVVYSAHSLEHLYPHEVSEALREFHRVLKPGGTAMIIVPNLEDVQPTFDVVYETGTGIKVTGFDMFYGAPALIADSPHMAHHSGFTRATLEQALRQAGFEPSVRRDKSFNLIGAGRKPV